MLPPSVEKLIQDISIAEACKRLKPSPQTRLQLTRKVGRFNQKHFILPLSLVWKELTREARDELAYKAEQWLLTNGLA
jgi:hypothetical protein